MTARQVPALLLVASLFVGIAAEASAQDDSYTQRLNGTWRVAGGDTMPKEWIRTVPVPGLATMADPAFDVDLHGTENPKSLF
jgi:hypothetical protein